ncbi:MAG: hypothetical protein U0132_24265 [Gemmatimonadaceae bacterium]
MVDSNTVLWGQTIMYTCYCLAIIAVVGWFALRVTRPAGADPAVKPTLFYSFVGLLVLIGVSLHVITYNTIPWVKDDLKAAPVAADRTYKISVGDHRFTLPSERIDVPCGERVKFSVTSDDLTYGFGLFRDNNSMVMQMQVVPGHANDLVWTFDANGLYTIRSTEYSGPKGYHMVVKDAVSVTGCKDNDSATNQLAEGAAQ